MKKVLSIILCLNLILSNILISVNADTSATVRYNYKMDLGAESEFKEMYGYSGGTSQTPPQPAMSKSFVTGKYGSAMQITYPGFVINDAGKRYNGFVLKFKEEPIQLGFESINFVDYMKEVQNISFWVKTPITVAHGSTPAAANRVIEIIFETNAGKFSYKPKLPNTGDWVYMTVPLTSFTGSGTNLRQVFIDNKVTTIGVMNISFPYDTYFGAKPDSSTLTAPWEEPLTIDELLFDRSTAENPAINPPSKGEEAYHENAGLSQILVDNVPIENFDPSNTGALTTVPVPQYYTAQDIISNVKAVVAAPDIAKSSTQQAVSGATYVITPPVSLPGTGSITVKSASTKVNQTYMLNFVFRSSFHVYENNITGININGSLTSGSKSISIPFANESADTACSASAFAVVRNRTTGAVVSIDKSIKENVSPKATDTFGLNVNVPSDADNYMLNIYFLDALSNLNMISKEIAINCNVTSNLTSNGTLIEKYATYNDETNIVNVSGKVKNAAAGEKVFIAVYKPDGSISNVISAAINNDGTFNVSYLFDDVQSGKYTANVGVGGVVSEGNFYLLSEQDKATLISAYNSLSASSADNELLAFYDTYMESLQLPDSLFAVIADSKISVLKDAVKSDYNSTLQIKNAIEEQLALKILNKFDTLVEIKNLYQNYNNIAKFNNNKDYFINYIKTDAQLDAILSKLAKGTYFDLGAAHSRFEDLSLVGAINGVLNFTEIGELINSNKTQIGTALNYSTLSGLSKSKQSDFYKYIASKDIEELSDLGEFLTEFIKKQTNDVPSSGGGSGGGGGSVVTNITVQTPPVPTPPPVKNSKKFEDLENVSWAEASIYALSDMGVVNGKTDKLYAPNDNITREEFTKLLVGTFSLPKAASDVEFKDADENQWYYDYIKTANQLNIIKGKSEDVFGIGENITRQDIAVMVARLMTYFNAKLPNSENTLFNDDSSIDNYAKQSVYQMKQIGIINGVGDNSFVPQQSATRAEAAKIIYSVYQYMK